jgi:hypothetical protein
MVDSEEGSSKRPCTISEYCLPPLGASVNIKLSAEDLNSTAAGYTALPNKWGILLINLDNVKYLQRELGFAYIKYKKTARAIVDSRGRCFAFIGGKPEGQSYNVACQDAAFLLETFGATNTGTETRKEHHRGVFTVVNVGVELVPGHKEPKNITIEPDQAEATNGILQSESIRQLATAQKRASFYSISTTED